jgi:hypothetical protein
MALALPPALSVSHARRCFAALGDISRVQYLQEINSIILSVSGEYVR